MYQNIYKIIWGKAGILGKLLSQNLMGDNGGPKTGRLTSGSFCGIMHVYF
jgi:hypothetical protein